MKISIKGGHRFKLRIRRSLLHPFVFLVTIAVVGIVGLVLSRAAFTAKAVEAEQGRTSGSAMVMTMGGASGGIAVHFGMPMNNSLGNILYNSTLGARFTQYKNDSEAIVTQNLATRGNYEANPSSPQPGSSNCGSNGCQGQFRTYCQYSHLNYDDPIVYPGQSGKAHLHLYWGNMSADSNTTNERLVNSGGGSCEGY